MITRLSGRIRAVVRFFLVAVLLCLTLGSCTTSRENRQQYTKDGIEYGVTEGPFRGRWWSYYERARSYQKGGFLKEAEADLRVALQSRREDGLWPRTYGMHFIPEYFPHRELGINLFLQGDIEGSVAELETSLEQQYSARAADYYERAQRKYLDLFGGDVAPPTLDVITESDGLSETLLEFEGVAYDDTFVASIEVNGVFYDVRKIDDTVPFSMVVSLAPGQNSIPIRITDLSGKQFLTEVILENDINGPAVAFDPVTELPGIVRGEVFDPAGVASLFVDGRTVRRIEESPGLESFEVYVDASEAPVLFTSTDKLGNTTRGTIQIDGEETAASLPSAISVATTSPSLAASALATATRSVLAAKVVQTEPVEVHLANIVEGAAFYQDEIVVALKAESEEAIGEVTFLGSTIPIVPARNIVHVSQRVLLDSGLNVLDATAVDVKGNRAEDRRNVVREENALEVSENKLAIAVVPKSLSGDDFTQGMISTFLSTSVYETRVGSNDQHGIAGQKTIASRFTHVDRNQLGRILGEQELAASGLTAEEFSIALRQLIPYEVLLTFQAKSENGQLEIILEGFSSEKGVQITNRIEVAGVDSEKGKNDLLELLVLRLMQEFPRSDGETFNWRSEKFNATIAAQQGAREFRKCLVYRKNLATRGNIEYETFEVLGEAFITGVDRRQGFSYAEVIEPEERGVPLDELASEEGIHVVLK